MSDSNEDVEGESSKKGMDDNNPSDTVKETKSNLEGEDEDQNSDEVTALRDRNEALADRVKSQQDTIDELESERDQLRKALSKRTSELEEYKQRSEKREEQAHADAISEVVSDLTSVRDSLVRALDHDDDAEVLKDGITRTLNELDDTLESHGLTVINPEAGDSVDPHCHEVIHKQPDDEYEEGDILTVHSAGYEFDDYVLQAARVVVCSNE